MESRLINIIRQETGVDILERTSRRENVYGRMIFSYIMFKFNHYGYTKISRILKLNHATIIHYVKEFDNILSQDASFKDRYLNISRVYFGDFKIDDQDVSTKLMYYNIVMSLRLQDLEQRLQSPLHVMVDGIPKEKQSLILERMELIIRMNC
jgi:hypothetical protein